MLLINDIFPSINGEVSRLGQGSLCTFIRVQGCNLKCSYCDTEHAQAFNKGTPKTINQVVKEVRSLHLKNITITGGEPLCQRENLFKLVRRLKNLSGYHISIETNGSIPIPPWEVDCWVADWKTPSSGMRDQMVLKHLEYLDANDFLKFVIANREDFEDAISVIKQLNKIDYGYNNPRFAFSPTHRVLPAELLVKWMLEEKRCRDNSIILNLQLHKIVGVL